MVEETKNWVLSPERKAPQKSVSLPLPDWMGSSRKSKAPCSLRCPKSRRANAAGGQAGWQTADSGKGQRIHSCFPEKKPSRIAHRENPTGKSSRKNRIWRFKASDFPNKSGAFPFEEVRNIEQRNLRVSVPATQQAESDKLTVDEVGKAFHDRKRTTGQHHWNCRTVFCQDPLLRGAIRLNLLTDRVDIVRDLGWRRSTSALTDTDVKYLLLYFEQNYGLTSEKKLMAALLIVANENCYHPIQDVLNGLDGTAYLGYAPACITFWGQMRATMWKKCSSTSAGSHPPGYSIQAPSMRSCSVWWAAREPEKVQFFDSWQYKMSGSPMT